MMGIDSDRYIESILYRDYLRKHDLTLKEYENLKKGLSFKYQNDRKMYTSFKNDFIKKYLSWFMKRNRRCSFKKIVSKNCT